MLTAPVSFTPNDHRPNTALKIFKVSNNNLVPVMDVFITITRDNRFLGWKAEAVSAGARSNEQREATVGATGEKVRRDVQDGKSGEMRDS